MTQILQELAERDLVASFSRLFASDRPVFHAFEREGERLLYDLGSGSLLSLDGPSYCLMRGMEDGLSAEEIQRGLVDTWGADPAAVLAQAEELYGLGLFRGEAPEHPDSTSAVRESMHRHRPRNAMLLVHTSCNLACTYCYEVAAGFHSTGSSMPAATAEKIIDDYFERSGGRERLVITFFGGEPLLNFPVVRSSVAYAQKLAQSLGKWVGFSITTNGTLMDDEVVEFLVAHKFTVMLSIDGDPEKADIHRKDHGGKGATAKSIANGLRLVKAQRSAGIREATARATLTQENSSPEETRQFLRSAGFRRVVVGASSGRAGVKQPWDVQADAVEEGHVRQRALYREYVDQYPAVDDDRFSEIRVAQKRLRDGLTRPTPALEIGCGVGRNMLAYTESGAIYPCHRFVGDEGHIVGHLDKGGVDRGRLDEFYKAVQDAKDKKCSVCWARSVCQGTCPWSFSTPDGGVVPPDEKGCDSLRSSFELQLWAHSKTVAAQKSPEVHINPETHINTERALDEC